MATVLLNVSAEELRALNRQFGGVVQMNSTVETVFESALYLQSFWERVAVVVRSIAGGHLFDNGNKRTAFAAVGLFRERNHIVTGTLPQRLRETISLVAIHELTEIPAIATSLRGF